MLSLLGGVGAAVSLAIVMPFSESRMVHFYPVGYMVVITYGNVVQRLRFWYALTFTSIMLGIFVASVLSQEAFPPRLLWPISSMVISVALFTLCSNYFMERDERRRFLRTLRERSLVRDLTQAHARLKDISRIDSLTGLHNQKHIQQHLSLIWERAWRDRSALSLLLLAGCGGGRIVFRRGRGGVGAHSPILGRRAQRARAGSCVRAGSGAAGAVFCAGAWSA